MTAATARSMRRVECFEVFASQVPQRERLELIRSRAATVRSAVALVTAFLGERVFEAGALERLNAGWGSVRKCDRTVDRLRRDCRLGATDLIAGVGQLRYDGREVVI